MTRLVIMPLGDSLTYGLGAPGGYRWPLQERLIAAGRRFDLVGGMAPVPGDPGPDRNHWGRDGWLISGEWDPITGRHYVPLSPRAERSRPFSRPLSEDLPAAISGRYFSRQRDDRNVLLLQIGTNDVLNQVVERGSSQAGGIAAAVLNRLQSFLQLVDRRARSSGLRLEVLVGTLQQLAPTNSYGIPVSNTMRRQIDVVNRRLPAMVRTSGLNGINVRVVPVGAAVGGHLLDGIHPNGLGYERMAIAWYQAICDL